MAETTMDIIKMSIQIPRIRHVLIEKTRPEAMFIDLISCGLRAVRDIGYGIVANNIYLYDGEVYLFRIDIKDKYIGCSGRHIWLPIQENYCNLSHEEISEMIKISFKKHFEIDILHADWTYAF